MAVLIKQPLDSHLSLLIINSNIASFNTKERKAFRAWFYKILQSLIEILYLILKNNLSQKDLEIFKSDKKAV